MPISKYFKGHGKEVMKDMKERYGKKAKRVFHALANKRGLTGSGPFSDADVEQGYKRMDIPAHPGNPEAASFGSIRHPGVNKDSTR